MQEQTVTTLLSTPTFPNGSFNNGFTGWGVLNQRVRLGGVDAVAGFPTPFDSTNAHDGGIEASSLATEYYTTTIENERAVLLSNQGGVQNTPMGSGGVVHGPVIYSLNPVTIRQGTTVYFDWEASGGNDAFDVFGYVVNTNDGSTQVILNETGLSPWSAQPITKAQFTVLQTGDYLFVFVSGTWDATQGTVTGARLSIDNILVNPIGYTSGGNSLGDTISLTLEFDGPVNGLVGTTSNGIFLVNGIPVNAVWSGTDGDTVRVLTYTITEGDEGQVVIDEIVLKNELLSGISDFQSSDAIQDFDSGLTALTVVDGVSPTISVTANLTTLKTGKPPLLALP